MKKYIYGTVLVALIAALWIFSFNPPAVTNRVPSATVAITFRFPEGYKFTEGAPFMLDWQAESLKGTLSAPVKVRNFDPLSAPYKLVLMPLPDSEGVVLHARLYYCHEASRMCFQDDFQTRVPLVPKNTAVIPWVWKITPKNIGTGDSSLGTR